MTKKKKASLCCFYRFFLTALFFCSPILSLTSSISFNTSKHLINSDLMFLQDKGDYGVVIYDATPHRDLWEKWSKEHLKEKLLQFSLEIIGKEKVTHFLSKKQIRIIFVYFDYEQNEYEMRDWNSIDVLGRFYVEENQFLTIQNEEWGESLSVNLESYFSKIQYEF